MKFNAVILRYKDKSKINALISKVKKPSFPSKEFTSLYFESTGGTRDRLLPLRDSKVRDIFHDFHKEKGVDLKIFSQKETGNIHIVQGADLEYGLKDLPLVIQLIIDYKANVVFENHFQDKRPHRVVYLWHKIGDRILALLSNFFSNLNPSEIVTSYKAYRSEVIKSIDICRNRFEVETEATAKVAKNILEFTRLEYFYMIALIMRVEKWLEGWAQGHLYIVKFNIWIK